jgi:hypothetical protein
MAWMVSNAKDLLEDIRDSLRRPVIALKAKGFGPLRDQRRDLGELLSREKGSLSRGRLST